jgi:hypothetical protein
MIPQRPHTRKITFVGLTKVCLDFRLQNVFGYPDNFFVNFTNSFVSYFNPLDCREVEFTHSDLSLHMAAAMTGGFQINLSVTRHYRLTFAEFFSTRVYSH